VRKYAPSPGKIEDFEKRKRVREYHFYYFQYTSMIHAIIALITGNNAFSNNPLDPLALYYGGYRYNQPNHLYHYFVVCHASAYFLYDSIIEKLYHTDDVLTNFHHLVVLGVSYFAIRAPHSMYEYISKSNP